jgi:hypothetical protein
MQEDVAMTPPKRGPETSLQKLRRERREAEARARGARKRHREQLKARGDQHRSEIKSMQARVRAAEVAAAKWRKAAEGYLGDDLLTLVDMIREARRQERRETSGGRVRSKR